MMSAETFAKIQKDRRFVLDVDEILGCVKETLRPCDLSQPVSHGLGDV
jgi:hypothetical protein